MTSTKGKETGIGWVASAIGLGLLLFIADQTTSQWLSESTIRTIEWTIVVFWAVMTTFKHRWRAKKFWRIVAVAMVIHGIVLIMAIGVLANMSFHAFLGLVVIEGMLIVLAVAIGLGGKNFLDEIQ